MIYNNYKIMNTPRHMSDPCQGNFQSQCLCSKGDPPEWNFNCFLNNRALMVMLVMMLMIMVMVMVMVMVMIVMM